MEIVKKICLLGMVLLLAGALSSGMISSAQAKEKKPMPPPDLALLVYDLAEIEDTIDKRDWDTFFREINDYREYFVEVKHTFGEMGLTTPVTQFALTIGLLQKSGLAKDVKG